MNCSSAFFNFSSSILLPINGLGSIFQSPVCKIVPKGVLILNNIDEAKNELEDMLSNSKFGVASDTVVIEEFLDGIELSVFVLTDGKNYKILPTAKDYKRIGEGDTGLNTGGMGAISPVPFADGILMKKIEERIVIPTISGLIKENIDYKMCVCK